MLLLLLLYRFPFDYTILLFLSLCSLTLKVPKTIIIAGRDVRSVMYYQKHRKKPYIRKSIKMSTVRLD